MLTLEKVTRGTTIQGILPEQPVTVIDATWHGDSALEVAFKDSNGDLGSQILYREREPSLNAVDSQTPFAFDGRLI